MAAENYPGTPVRGTAIEGLDAAAECPGVQVFQAGTRRDGERLVADGGRVLAITALGPSAREAQARAYRAVDAVRWPGGFCRRDIGWRAVAWENRRPA
jgi:phosphoribosylamine--glycine ligase